MENQVQGEELNKNIAKKPKKKKFWIVILIIVLSFLASIPIIFLALVGLGLLIYNYLPGDASTNTFSVGMDTSVCSKTEITQYYDTVEEARIAESKRINTEIKDEKFNIFDALDSDYKDEYEFQKELVRFEDKDGITMVTLENSDNNKYIAIYTFAIKDNKYSNCLESVRYEIKNMITYEAVTRREEYDFDEEVASDLSISISLNQTSFSNDGVMIPYGLTDSEDICDVTIMGEEPTDIIPIDYDGITYYFWYFNSEAIDEQIREALQGNLDYKQVIDSMEIDINGE